MILYIAVTTIIFSFMMFILNIKENRHIGFLSLYLILYGLYSITHFSTLFSNNPKMVAFGWNNFSPFYLLAGPALYFYVKSSLEDRIHWKWHHLAHLIPFVAVAIGILPYWLTSINEKIKVGEQIVQDINQMKTIRMNWIFSNLFIYLSRPITIIGYIIASAIILIKKIKEEKKPNKQFKLIVRWIAILLAVSLVLLIILAIMGTNLFNDNVRMVLTRYQYLHALAGGLFVLIPICLMLFPQILYGVPVIENTITKNDQSSSANHNDNTSLSSLNKNDESFKLLSQRILEYFDNEKPYLQQNFSLTQLAIALNIPQHHVSYCFSEYLETTFTKLRTLKRIAYAQTLLREGITKDFTIEKVAELSGFSSRSTFFSAFKEQTGMTPAEYTDLKAE
ncbi:MAG: helix-turn-helix domain-containing protein [Bacteroidota bacterium]|jgi:AraC-like DNA-binding protein